ncbi:MAG: hypothetical protein H7Z18_05940 [Methylophilaceae bacterium]|nr:hypothetical protein [Methylophilaceae bacterium]
MKVFKLKSIVNAALAASVSIFAVVVQAQSLVGLNSSNQISIFDSIDLASPAFNTISRAGFGESFIEIDLRPSNNMVYGITPLK